MIAEVIQGAYDTKGKQVFEPRTKRYAVLFSPTFPMGRYVIHPLSVQCSDLDDLQHFLKQCRYVSDIKQFDKIDYWMPPDDFEEKKKGDCEDFALWTWRQLMAMGYDSRFVLGRSGRYGYGHAWVTFTEDGRTFLVEPALSWLSKKLPRLKTLRYKPDLSVSWKDDRLRYYEHHDLDYNPTFREVLPLVNEWVVFMIKNGHKIVARWIWICFLYAVSSIKLGVLGLKRHLLGKAGSS